MSNTVHPSHLSHLSIGSCAVTGACPYGRSQWLGREATVERADGYGPEDHALEPSATLNEICASWHQHRGPPGHVPGSPIPSGGGGDVRQARRQMRPHNIGIERKQSHTKASGQIILTSPQSASKTPISSQASFGIQLHAANSTSS
ncbi:hypothetical protein V493_02547 [Pseudogymnoascus sp. VKM F-4281 (FW-2241)]|nr:hypothetical protein V493_02547 [Pseudogymnoascus sp. VKM F-4281 (FW-2241)]